MALRYLNTSPSPFSNKNEFLKSLKYGAFFWKKQAFGSGNKRNFGATQEYFLGRIFDPTFFPLSVFYKKYLFLQRRKVVFRFFSTFSTEIYYF